MLLLAELLDVVQQRGQEPDRWVFVRAQVKCNAKKSLDHVSLLSRAKVCRGNPTRCHQAEAKNIHLVAQGNLLSFSNDRYEQPCILLP